MRCQCVWVCVCVCVMWSILRHFRSFFGRYFRRRRRRSVMGWHATMIDNSPWVGWRRNLEVKEPGRSKCHRLQTNNQWRHSLLSHLIFTVLIPSSLLQESLFPFRVTRIESFLKGGSRDKQKVQWPVWFSINVDVYHLELCKWHRLKFHSGWWE
jgi:hypothetical protein